jgi:hypothetical protein
MSLEENRCGLQKGLLQANAAPQQRGGHQGCGKLGRAMPIEGAPTR